MNLDREQIQIYYIRKCPIRSQPTGEGVFGCMHETWLARVDAVGRCLVACSSLPAWSSGCKKSPTARLSRNAQVELRYSARPARCSAPHPRVQGQAMGSPLRPLLLLIFPQQSTWRRRALLEGVAPDESNLLLHPPPLPTIPPSISGHRCAQTSSLMA